MSKKIIVTIPLVGISQGHRGITVETTGFVGPACQTATENIQKAMGQVVNEELTAEYYEQQERLEFLNHGDKANG